MKQSKIEIHGEKKKLVVKLPASDSSSPGSGPKCTSSPVVIDLDSSDSAKSSRSGRSGRSGQQTRNSSKHKLELSPPSAPVKKHKGKGRFETQERRKNQERRTTQERREN